MKIMQKFKWHILLVTVFMWMGYALVAQEKFEDFDWNSYKAWENATFYSKTIVVNQRHPEASDENPGTKEKPLKTINRAARLVHAGERVLIYSGVYREMVEPQNGGQGPDKMISYESAPGENVIIKGSRILKNHWIQRRVLTDVLPDTTLTYTWSRKTWLTTLPDSLFENDYFPFQLPNILSEEHLLMPWAKLTKKLAPYNSTRGLIFQNGNRMTQLEDYGDLARVPGSFWVDNDGKTIHIHAYGSGNPNNELFEIGVQSHLFKPQKIGLGYIRIQGITFEHCANGFLRTSTGAVNARGGHHWIIEDNTIRQINSSGLEFGYNAFELNDPNPENIQPRTDKNYGGMIVRNNQISDCGTAGIRSFVVHNAIIEGNHIWNCGWQDAENYWECSAIKILLARKTLVKGNHIHHIQGGNGIWLDWDNKYSRVTGNLIHDIQNVQGGIFLEASQTPNLIDNNIIWNIDGNGIYGNDTDFLMVYHNLVANTTGHVVHAVVATQRKLNNRWLTATKNKVYNNIFINGGKPIAFSSDDNEADHNLYVTTREPQQIDLEKWQKSGKDLNSNAIRSFVKFNWESKYLVWRTTENIEEVPVLPEINSDYFNKKRGDIKSIPGPFSILQNQSKVLLDENGF